MVALTCSQGPSWTRLWEPGVLNGPSWTRLWDFGAVERPNFERLEDFMKLYFRFGKLDFGYANRPGFLVAAYPMVSGLAMEASRRYAKPHYYRIENRTTKPHYAL